MVLDTSNVSLLMLIICNFTYKNGSGSAYLDLLARFKSFPIADGVIELAMVYIVG